MKQDLNKFAFFSKNFLWYSIMLVIENDYNPLNWWLFSGVFPIVITIFFELYILGTSLNETETET
jgi:hypothetical protein